MDEVFAQHIQRMRAATTNQYNRSDLLKWVTTHTYLNGKPFSTKGHEYQERIMLDQSQEIAVKKPSQVGISELSLRMSLGLVTMLPNFSLIYTMPTATLASLYTKTRLDPIIAQSPLLKSAIRGEVDSSESKQLGPNNFLFIRGSTGANAAIAVPASMIVTDEEDFSDPNIVEMTNSRMSHSPWKLRLRLSTPTTPNGPIDKAFKNSRRHFNFVRCNHCSHMFYPTYWNDVKIPGYSGDLRDINKELLATLRYKESAVVCPRCGKRPSLQPEHREWVCENPEQSLVTAGYQISPFDAPSFVTVPSLVEVSTKYNRQSQFANFHLGETAVDAETGITDDDLERIGVLMAKSPFTTHVMGIDVGRTSHITIGGVGSDLKLGIVHMERVPLAQFRERYFALKAQFRVSITVMDLQPFTDLVMSLCDEDQNLFGATYVTRNGLELFDVRMREENTFEAIGAIKQVSLNRNAVFDRILADIRAGNIWVAKGQEWPLYKEHLQDMKRASATLRSGEFTSMWQKSGAGNDHFHHSTGYCWVASQMRGVASGSLSMGGPAVSTFKLKGPQTPQELRQQRFGIRR
jgi:hypothetical protein